MQCLYNTYSDNIAGYCLNPKHPYAMTPKQIACKNCCGKQCQDFKKEESHQIWRQKEAKKKKRKERKKRLDDYVNKVQGKI